MKKGIKLFVIMIIFLSLGELHAQTEDFEVLPKAISIQNFTVKGSKFAYKGCKKKDIVVVYSIRIVTDDDRVFYAGGSVGHFIGQYRLVNVLTELESRVDKAILDNKKIKIRSNGAEDCEEFNMLGIWIEESNEWLPLQWTTIIFEGITHVYNRIKPLYLLGVFFNKKLRHKSQGF